MDSKIATQLLQSCMKSISSDMLFISVRVYCDDKLVYKFDDKKGHVQALRVVLEV